MSIEHADIEKIAHLARIKLDEQQIPAISQSLNNILQLINALQEVDTTNVLPMGNPHDARQTLREDIVTSINHRERLLENAPLTESGLFLVPKVIE